MRQQDLALRQLGEEPTIDSENPVMENVRPIACARKSGSPMAAPASTPSEREMMEEAPPPMFLFVASAEMDRAARKVIEVASVTIRIVKGSPTWPRTQPERRDMMTPKIVRRLGT